MAHPIWAAYGAIITLIVGLLAGLVAIVTGLTNWNTNATKRHVSLNHTLYNACAIILYLISFVPRLLVAPRDSFVAAILGFIGLLTLIYSAYLGRVFVFTKGTSINLSVWQSARKNDESALLVDHPNILAGIARWAIIGFAALVALEQLQISPALINVLFTAIVGAVALAFGLIGRQAAQHMLNRTEGIASNVSSQVNTRQMMDQMRSTAQMQADQKQPDQIRTRRQRP